MTSKKCQHCGFTNFADAATCKRCGEKLLTARQAAYREERQAAMTKGASVLCTSCGSTGDPQLFRPAAAPGVVLIVGGIIMLFIWPLFGVLMIAGFVAHCIYREVAKYQGCSACSQKAIIPINSPAAKQFIARQSGH